MNNSPALESTNQILNYIRQKGIAHLSVDKSELTDNTILVNSEKLVNFGSCSYLGLEFDKRLKNGAIQAINDYGTQFSSSRAYLALNLYNELELKLEKIFQGHVVVTPTTTLGHISTIPVIVNKNDLVIMDQQVHNSVQTAVKMVKADGTEVNILRHNRMDLLEREIKMNYEKYEKIWYMADGIYSMFGDKAPMDEIHVLLNKYVKFNFYVDDAHAMSCYGERGQGYALENHYLHERMILGTSLNKAFASGGGVFVFPNKELAQRVKNCGGPMITSGPMQPAALGSAIAAANIHLSPDISVLQSQLKENILYTHILLEKYGLPNVAEKDSPIFFIGVGLPKVGYNLVSRLIKSGHMVNIGIFPAVPMKNTGVRFTITRLHTFEQIEKMVRDMAYHYKRALADENYTIDQVFKAFKLTPPENLKIEQEIQKIINPKELELVSYSTIIDVDKTSWDSVRRESDLTDWNGLNVLESSFKNNADLESNWNFDYVIISDARGKIVLSTFLTSGISKDDMLANAELSKDIEKIRETDQYFYTSKFLCVGSMITEGNHLYLDKDSKYTNLAMQLLFDKIDELQKKYNATTLIIRDLPSNDSLMDDIMVDNGFFKSEMPENYSLDISDWNTDESFSTTLSKRSKRHFKENVVRFEHLFEVNVIQSASENQLSEFYNLYSNVFDKSLEINTFKLPKKFFEVACENDNWEILNLSLKENPETSVGAILLHKGQNAVTGVIVGLDYKLNYQFNVYRQSIYQLIIRAKGLGYSKINFGFSAGIEKKKFGAIGHKSCAYMQVKDNFKFESLMAGTFRKEMKDEVAQLD